jgi:hypothetical protein
MYYIRRDRLDERSGADGFGQNPRHPSLQIKKIKGFELERAHDRRDRSVYVDYCLPFQTRQSSGLGLHHSLASLHDGCFQPVCPVERSKAGW